MQSPENNKADRETLVGQYSKIVSACFVQGLSIAMFCRPGETTVTCFIGNARKVKFSEIRNNEFVISPFDHQGEVWVIPSEYMFYDLDFDGTEELNAESYVQHRYAPVIPSRKYYEKLVSSALAEIETGRLKKVVVARQKMIEFNPEYNPVNLFFELNEKYNHSFACYVMGPEIGTWLGASPELLLELRGNKFFTNALAGTRVEDGNTSIEQFSEKDKSEQQIVTDYIVNQLRSLNLDVNIHAPAVVSAGNIQHILTRVEGTSHLSPWKILKSLHPTPAVCGYPVNEAFSFIKKNELLPRWFYSGFWGPYYSKSEAMFYVNLRCMELRPLKMILFAGAGIVKGSDPSHEFDETNDKMNTLIEAVLNTI